MAGADYYHCDMCGQKAFYDADVDWESAYVGDMKVICLNCAETHKCVIVEKETPDA